MKYVSIGKPIKIKEFKELEKPLGWIRIDLLIKKLEDETYRKKFIYALKDKFYSNSEKVIKTINEVCR